jgi:hypothetical protein
VGSVFTRAGLSSVYTFGNIFAEGDSKLPQTVANGAGTIPWSLNNVVNTAFVQGNSSTNNVSSTTSIAFGVANTVGNCIVAMVETANSVTSPPGTPPTFVVSDTRGNVYNAVGPATSCFLSGHYSVCSVQVYVAFNIHAGANTVSVTATGSFLVTSLWISEFTGNPTINPVVMAASAIASPPASPATISMNLTTTQLNEMVILSGLNSTPAGFTNMLGQGGFTAYKTISTAGTATYTGTVDSGFLWGLVLTDTATGYGYNYTMD